MFNNKLLLLLCCSLLLIISIVILFSRKHEQILKMMSVSPYPTAIYNPPTPTRTPSPAGLTLDSIDWNTTNWKTYKGNYNGKYSFTIKYPESWIFEKTDLGGVYYPFGKKSNEDSAINNPSPRIILGVAGHGAPPQPYYPRSFQTGQASYGWQVINNKIYAVADFRNGDKQYLFEIGFIPIKNKQEENTLKRIFDTMLNTFVPLN